MSVSQVDKPATAGRFGLGFNSVYHFTDVPSFVSGDYLVYFDPHAVNLPGTSLAQPGLKISATSGRLLLQFPDQFSPFLFFGCSLASHFEGTLFRFPLRSAAAAARSEIKPEAYSLTALKQLIEAFREGAPRTLLFLKNVTKVSAWVARAAPPGAGAAAGKRPEPELLYEASLFVPEGQADPRQPVVDFVRGGGGGKMQSQRQFLDRLAALPEDRLPAGWGEVRIRMSVSAGAGSGPDGQPSETEPITKEDSPAAPPAASSTTSRWLVVSALGGGRARQLAVSDAAAARGLVPWVGVAAPLPSETESLPVTSGRAFCFLPLPARTYPASPNHTLSQPPLCSRRPLV